MPTPLTAGRRWRTRSRAALAVPAALGLTVVAVASALTATTAQAAPTATTAPLTVTTPYGTLRGATVGGAQAFYGVPFAKPPVYQLAFRPPQAPTAWNGVRDATRQGPACTQFQPTGVTNAQPTSEDCLYLDVYRPATVKAGSRLPVIVFYHGGGNTQGSGVLYGGQTLATRTNTIVVSTNYRLGALGALALPALSAQNPSQGSGDQAVLDQVQALRWVQSSIAPFGGNPANVTIFGQSAGAAAVCNMLAAPLAKGLFHKAIMQSIGCSTAPNPAATAEATGLQFAAAAGCPQTDASVVTCLQNLWPAALVTAFQHVAPRGAVTGNAVLPLPAGTAIEQGRWNKVPVMVGGTREEGKLFVVDQAGITAAGYRDRILTQYGRTAGRAILAEYPVAAYGKPFYALAAVSTDSGIGCAVASNATRFAGLTPTYRYEFNDPTSPTLFGFQPPGIDMSNAHSAELAYLFDFTLGDRPLTATQQNLAHRMQDYWAAFARTGAPNVAGLAFWPRYTAGTTQTLVLQPRGASIATGITAEHNCAFWANLPR